VQVGGREDDGVKPFKIERLRILGVRGLFYPTGYGDGTAMTRRGNSGNSGVAWPWRPLRVHCNDGAGVLDPKACEQPHHFDSAGEKGGSGHKQHVLPFSFQGNHAKYQDSGLAGAQGLRPTIAWTNLMTSHKWLHRIGAI